MTLRALTLAVAVAEPEVVAGGELVPAAIELTGGTLTLRFAEPVTVAAGQALSVQGCLG